MADDDSVRVGARLKYPFCLLEVSGGGAAGAVCFDKLPDEDDERDCCDVLGRTPTERLARAALVFSRAIAAIDSLLFLA